MDKELEKAFYNLIHTRRVAYLLEVDHYVVKMARQYLKENKVSMERKIEWLRKAGFNVEIKVTGKMKPIPPSKKLINQTNLKA